MAPGTQEPARPGRATSAAVTVTLHRCRSAPSTALGPAHGSSGQGGLELWHRGAGSALRTLGWQGAGSSSCRRCGQTDRQHQHSPPCAPPSSGHPLPSPGLAKPRGVTPRSTSICHCGTNPSSAPRHSTRGCPHHPQTEPCAASDPKPFPYCPPGARPQPPKGGHICTPQVGVRPLSPIRAGYEPAGVQKNHSTT